MEQREVSAIVGQKGTTCPGSREEMGIVGQAGKPQVSRRHDIVSSGAKRVHQVERDVVIEIELRHAAGYASSSANRASIRALFRS